MDEIAAFNRERWNALVNAGILYARPWLDLTPDTAKSRLDPDGLLPDMRGKQVLCLANGGGQQSAAFALLGAKVTVLDLSDAQLEQDRRAAENYGYTVQLEQGDMRDLSRFSDASFDLVCQWYSINFIPDPLRVFNEVARVLRAGGHYWLGFGNPHRFTLQDETWRDGYRITRPYQDGEAAFADDYWEIEQEGGSVQRVLGPREFCHTWTTIHNGLASRGFVIRHVSEYKNKIEQPEIGTWEHFLSLLPPYITYWMVYRPDIH
jgi:ubiquinone/menaquinone biosynthesis C-methylase UbiE